MQTLRVQHNKIGLASYRLKERDKILFQTCINALNDKNKEKAAIFANEVAEIRKLLKLLYNVELAIERVILRLETVKELSDFVTDLKPALRLLQGVSQELFNVLPDVSSELSKVNETISDTLYSTKITTDASIIPVDRKTPGGEEVLNEVYGFVEQKLTATLPEPPATQKVTETKQTTLKEMVSLTSDCSKATSCADGESDDNPLQTLISYRKAEIKEISLRVEKPSLEEELLDYVKRTNGEIDLGRCSADLRSSNEEIEKALENLGTRGKIKIEVQSGE